MKITLGRDSAPAASLPMNVNRRAIPATRGRAAIDRDNSPSDQSDIHRSFFGTELWFDSQYRAWNHTGQPFARIIDYWPPCPVQSPDGVQPMMCGRVLIIVVTLAASCWAAPQ